MTGKVVIKVDDRRMNERLQALVNAGGRPLFESIGRKLQTYIDFGFQKSRDPWNKAWKPLKFRKGQPLLDTRHMHGSIKYHATDKYVEVGTNVKYAPIHQFGATIKPKSKKVLVFPNKIAGGLVFAKQVTVPARPFLPLNLAGQLDLPKPWQKAVLGVIKAHLRKVAEGVPA